MASNKTRISLKKRVLRPIRRFRERIAYLYDRSIPTPPPTTRVVIFARGRTGSSLLETLLHSSGHFTRYGEIFNVRLLGTEIKDPIRYVRGLAKMKARRNIIFHVKVDQLAEKREHPVDPAEFINALYRDGWKIVYLRRLNRIKHALSTIVAAHRGRWHKYDDSPVEVSIELDCMKLVKMVEGGIQREHEEARALQSVEYHEVVYENDLEHADSHQQTADKIFEYLSLEKRQVSSFHKKIHNLPLDKLINNYPEFVECVKANGWQEFID